MKIGFIGLGRMGGNMVERLIKDGHEIVGYALSEAECKAAQEKGAVIADSLENLIAQLHPLRVIWVMIPAGDPTEKTILQLSEILSAGDILIDGGNSNFNDTQRRAGLLKAKGISFLDSGTSGGIWGLKNGYCIMVGGDTEAFQKTEPIFQSLAPQDGYLHVGPNGAGHFVKMIHNGIEYGMLQAYAEGFEILHAKKEFNLDLNKICHLWNQGSVVRSWLLELAESAFAKDPQLEQLTDYVEDSGEGRWTIEEAMKLDIPAPVITLALQARFRSRQKESFGAKSIAALRNEFGGHAIKKGKE